MNLLLLALLFSFLLVSICPSSVPAAAVSEGPVVAEQDERNYSSFYISGDKNKYVDLLPGEARPVLTNLIGIEFADIADAEQTFKADFYLTLYYQNGHEDVVSPSVELPTIVVEFVPSDLESFDDLEIEFKTGVEIQEVYGRVLALHSALPLGPTFGVIKRNVSWPWTEVDMHYRGTFRSEFDLRNFPFDEQILKLAIEFTRHTSDQFVFQPRVGNSIVSPTVLAPTGFFMHHHGSESHDVFYPSFQETYSRYTGSVRVTRQVGAVYGVRIISTLFITTVMTFVLYVFPILEVTRHQNAALFFLASVTYLFVIMEDLPEVPYTTRLDNFIVVSLLNNMSCYVWFSMSYWVRKVPFGMKMRLRAMDTYRRYEPWLCPLLVAWYALWSTLCLTVTMRFEMVWVAYGCWNVLYLAGTLLFFKKFHIKPKDVDQLDATRYVDDEDNFPKFHCELCCPVHATDEVASLSSSTNIGKLGQESKDSTSCEAGGYKESGGAPFGFASANPNGCAASRAEPTQEGEEEGTGSPLVAAPAGGTGAAEERRIKHAKQQQHDTGATHPRRRSQSRDSISKGSQNTHDATLVRKSSSASVSSNPSPVGQQSRVKRKGSVSSPGPSPQPPADSGEESEGERLSGRSPPSSFRRAAKDVVAAVRLAHAPAESTTGKKERKASPSPLRRATPSGAGEAIKRQSEGMKSRKKKEKSPSPSSPTRQKQLSTSGSREELVEERPVDDRSPSGSSDRDGSRGRRVSFVLDVASEPSA